MRTAASIPLVHAVCYACPCMSALHGSPWVIACEDINVMVDGALLCAESADSAHAEREPQPVQQQYRKQQPLRAAFRVLLPGQERRDKGEHIV